MSDLSEDTLTFFRSLGIDTSHMAEEDVDEPEIDDETLARYPQDRTEILNQLKAAVERIVPAPMREDDKVNLFCIAAILADVAVNSLMLMWMGPDFLMEGCGALVRLAFSIGWNARGGEAETEEKE